MFDYKDYNKEFSKIYDTYGWNYYPEYFAEMLLDWMEREQISCRKALDIGCGTGILCNALYQKGMQVKGVDLSAEMLRRAQEHFPQIDFEVQNMVQYRPEESYDLVTCTHDAINHVLDMEDVEQVMKNVYGYLQEGGYFIFDLLKDMELTDDTPVVLDESEEGVLLFQGTRDLAGFVNLNIFREKIEEDGTVERKQIDTVHERVYDTKWMTELLRRTGFKEIQLVDRFPGSTGDGGTSWIVIARR